MRFHEARLKQHIRIGGFRSSGTIEFSSEGYVIEEIKLITTKKLDIKCKNVVDGNEQSQTIKALTQYGENIISFLEKNKSLLIGKEVSELYNFEID